MSLTGAAAGHGDLCLLVGKISTQGGDAKLVKVWRDFSSVDPALRRDVRQISFFTLYPLRKDAGEDGVDVFGVVVDICVFGDFIRAEVLGDFV